MHGESLRIHYVKRIGAFKDVASLSSAFRRGDAKPATLVVRRDQDGRVLAWLSMDPDSKDDVLDFTVIKVTLASLFPGFITYSLRELEDLGFGWITSEQRKTLNVLVLRHMSRGVMRRENESLAVRHGDKTTTINPDGNYHED